MQPHGTCTQGGRNSCNTQPFSNMLLIPKTARRCPHSWPKECPTSQSICNSHRPHKIGKPHGARKQGQWELLSIHRISNTSSLSALSKGRATATDVPLPYPGFSCSHTAPAPMEKGTSATPTPAVSSSSSYRQNMLLGIGETKHPLDLSITQVQQTAQRFPQPRTKGPPAPLLLFS